MGRSDQYYVEQCLDGRPDEFRYLVGRYQAVLLAFLGGKLGNRSFAEEAAQETFVRAYFGLADLKKRASFYSWLLGIAGRVAKEQLREQSRHGVIDSLTREVIEPKAADDHELERAIVELGDSYREMILLRFYAGWSCVEIAEKLDMPTGTVTKTLSRAYAKLRKSLKKQRKDSEVQK